VTVSTAGLLFEHLLNMGFSSNGSIQGQHSRHKMEYHTLWA